MAGRKYLSCTGRILYGKSRLIDINQLKQYDKYFYKIFFKKRLTANLFKRIVRFFAAAEAADELKSIARNVGNI
ncbi:hypothetical protein QWW44_11445, partial [Neisseria gonorrhoeae]